jgi:hypothetical protein
MTENITALRAALADYSKRGTVAAHDTEGRALWSDQPKDLQLRYLAALGKQEKRRNVPPSSLPQIRQG